MLMLYIVTFVTTFSLLKILDETRQYLDELQLHDVLIKHFFDYHMNQFRLNTQLHQNNINQVQLIRDEFNEFSQNVVGNEFLM